MKEALEAVGRPFIEREVLLALRDREVLIYDGDLTRQPVSNASTTYHHLSRGCLRLDERRRATGLPGGLGQPAQSHPRSAVAVGGAAPWGYRILLPR